MKHLEVFEVHKTRSVNKDKADNVFAFFDMKHVEKIDAFKGYDIFKSVVGDYYICENNEPFLYFQYKNDSIVIEDENVVLPMVQYYVLKTPYRGKGFSTLAYDWLMSKHHKVISDTIQSDGDMFVWTLLFKKYKVVAYDAKSYEAIDDVYVAGKKLQSDSLQIYNSANRLIAMEVGIEPTT